DIVDVDAAKIKVTATTDKREGDADIDGERGNGSPHHPALDHGHRSTEALESFIAEPERKQDQDKGVGEGSECAGAVIAIGLFAIGRPLGPAHREIGNAERGDVGKVVNRVVQKGHAPAKNAPKDLRYHQTERGGYSPTQQIGRAHV